MTDTERIDVLQRLLVGADFHWGDPSQAVVVFALPMGVGINGDVRKFLDDASAKA